MPKLQVVNKANEAGEIYIYGYIADEKWHEEDTTPKSFREAISALDGAKNIDLYINSGGGSVYAGQAIYSMLRRHSATVTAHVDGVCASITTVVAMGADKIVMPRNALMMIHEPVAFLMGWFGVDDLRKEADAIEKVRSTIVATYKERAKTSEEEIAAMMKEETWMTGEEAVAFGFADELDEQKAVEACLRGDTAIVNGEELPTDRYKAFPHAKFVPQEPPKPPEQTPDYGNLDRQIWNLSTTIALKEAI